MANEKNSEDALEEMEGAQRDGGVEATKHSDEEQVGSLPTRSDSGSESDEDIDGRDFELSDADWADDSLEVDSADKSAAAGSEEVLTKSLQENTNNSEATQTTESSAKPVSIRKLYGLPIDEIEELLTKQQAVQAQTFKIVRHLRAAEDKIALVKREKLAAVEELAEAREEIELFKTECTEFQKKLRDSQSAKIDVDRQLQSQDNELSALREQIDQMRASHLKQQAEQVTLLEGFKTKLTEYGNIREQLQAAQEQSQREQSQIAELNAELTRVQQQEGALRDQLKGAAEERADLLKLIKAAMVRLERKDTHQSSKTATNLAASSAAAKPPASNRPAQPPPG
jgi:chromosome segregation ATPase